MKRLRSGQSLVEILLAVAIGAILITAAVTLIVPSLQANTQAAKVQTASSLGKELLDNVRVWAEGNWNNVLTLATGTTNTYYLNTTSSPYTAAGSGSSSSSLYNGYSYERSITVTANTSIASGTQSSFPMLVSSTVSSWIYPSGNIKNICTAPNGGPEPCDLIFTSDSGCTNLLNFETESYSSSTGALVDWVNVSSLSAGTVIYACYGKSSVSADQSHPSLTWDSNFKGVWHLAAPTGTLTAFDSTGVNNGAITSTTAATGEIDGAARFSTSTAVINAGTSTSLNITAQPLTLSMWVNSAGSGGGASGRVVDRNPDYTLWLGNGRTPTFSTNGTSLTVSATTNALNYGTTAYLSVVYATNTVTFYINGAVNSSTAYSNTLTSATEALCLGNRTNGTTCTNDRYVNSMLDEIRISNFARSPSWITTEYNNQSSPSTFYTLGNEVGGGSSATSTIQSMTIGTSTYNRYFYLSDVYRDGSGNIVTSGGTYDPSTKQVTVAYGWPGGTTSTMTTYIVRGMNNVVTQSDWSGGPGQSGPATSTNNSFTTSSNIDYSSGTGSVYVAIPGY